MSSKEWTKKNEGGVDPFTTLLFFLSLTSLVDVANLGGIQSSNRKMLGVPSFPCCQRQWCVSENSLEQSSQCYSVSRTLYSP